MLSIQELKLMIEKLDRFDENDLKTFIGDFKQKLSDLAVTVDAYNDDQIAQLDKPKQWYQKDLDWRHERKDVLHDELLYNAIQSKIGQFATHGNNLQNCLEIGPGYGTYLECLLSWRLIYFVDIIQECFTKIKKRINTKHHKFLRFYTTDKTACNDIPVNSCNFVFSWDTFPFFTQEHIDQYLKDIHRVMMPGGYGLIHYADCNFDADLHEAKRGYWNFNTKERMTQIVKDNGFDLVETEQFRPKANYIVFRKPGNQNPVVYKIIEIPVEK